MLKELYQEFILKYQKVIIIGGITAVSACLFIIIYCCLKEEKKIIISEASDKKIAEIEEKPVRENITYYVDLKGAVVNPNVYQIKDGSRVIDAINLAGGLKETADTSVLNLSKKVIDEMVIIIYTKDEISEFKKDGKTKEEVIKYIEKECLCPDPTINDACISEGNNNTPVEDDTLVSLNHATKDEFMTLPGIGETKALDIIAYRTANGEFKTIDELKNVKGIGDSTFDKIKDFITL